MTTEPTLSGGCACGAVRYEITGEPGFAFMCHCRHCQRQTGAGHAPGFKVDLSQLTLKGAQTSFAVTADSGFDVVHRFCPTCGAPILNAPQRFPDSVAIFVGSLDDPSAFEPKAALFQDSAQPWDHIDPQFRD